MATVACHSRRSTEAANLPLNSPAEIEIDSAMSNQKARPWEGLGLPRSCLAWVAEVDGIMLEEFCIDLSDAGADRADILRYWKFNQSPDEFVDWFGEKYDLITRDQWDPFGIARRAIRP